MDNSRKQKAAVGKRSASLYEKSAVRKSVGRGVGSLPVNGLSIDLCMALQSDRLSMAARLL